MCILYCLRGVLVVLVALNLLVVMLAIDGSFDRGWQNHAKSAAVPVIMFGCLVSR